MKRDQKLDEAAAKDGMAAWTRERAELLATIQRQQEDAERLAKRFRLLQRTLVDQQRLLDRYQQALVHSGSLEPPPSNASDKDGGNKASTTASGNAASSASAKAASASKAAIKTNPQAPTVDRHRALTTANTAKNATSSILQTTPVAPRVMTQDTEELVVAATTDAAASTSASSSKSRQQVSLHAVATPYEAKGKVVAQPTKSSSSSIGKPATSDVTPSSIGASKGDEVPTWTSRKADFHRAPPVTMKADVKPEPSPSSTLSNSSSKTTPTTPVPHPVALAGVKRKAKSSSDRAPTWAQEKQRMKEAGIIMTTGKRRFADMKPSVSAAAAQTTKGDASSQSGDEKGNAFQYVEVVRNREARAALPGHDCVECRKYYEALDGLIPDADAQLAKAKCSRHRAKFEPYNTPDDFWCLSFPDSEPQRLSP